MAIDDILMVGGVKTLRGVTEEALSQNINLLCFHLNLYKDGNQFPPAWEALGHVLDGLIIYQPWPSKDLFNAFRKRFPSLPMINAVRLYEGCPGLTPDSYQGMTDLLEHLVGFHGYKKIAFVTGPEGNWAADERYRSYVDVLTKHGLLIDDNLVTPHLGWDTAREAIAYLMDRRQLKPGSGFEAVIGANDSLAMGVLEEFRIRGVQVPGDVAVVGFDNDSRTFFSNPPLTTAGYDMGKQAAKTMLAMLEGKKVPDRTFVPAIPVIRRSCGCQSAEVMRASGWKEEPRDKKTDRQSKKVFAGKNIREDRSRILAEISASLEDKNAKTANVLTWIGQLLDAFVINLDAGDKPPTFLLALEKVLYLSRIDGGDFSVWQGVVSAMRRQLLRLLDGEILSRAESLWQQSRVLIEDMGRREQIRQASLAEQRAQVLREIEMSLLTTFSVAGLMALLAKNLPRLGIESCYLALYEGKTRSRLALAFSKSQAAASDNRFFETLKLLPDGTLPETRFTYIVEPLNFQERQLGFALFGMGPQEGTIYDGLRGTLSSALQGALLLEQIQEHAGQLDSVVERTLMTSEEIQRAITETTSQAQIVSRSAQVSMDVSRNGQEAIANTVAGMDTIRRQVENIAKSILALSERTKQIEEIVTAVEEVVSLSDVLAINASIQAARAGDRGLGFAVVAREMRTLAEQSRNATANISTILKEIKDAAANAVLVTEEGSKGAVKGISLAGRAGETIHDLSSTIEESARVALQISASTQQQANAIDQLVKAVQSIKEANSQTSTTFKAAGL